MTEVFGVGAIVAATVIGDVGDISRFPTRDHFAAYNGTAPIEVSSGGRRKVFRLSRRGNRRMNHAIHMAAVTQIRHRHGEGRAYSERKRAEGHSGKEAIHALKRRIGEPLRPPPRGRRAGRGTDRDGPGRAAGNDSVASAAGSHPEHRLSGCPRTAAACDRPATELIPRSRKHRGSVSKKSLDRQRGLVRLHAVRCD